METSRESLCCKETPKLLENKNELEVPVSCLTEQPGFVQGSLLECLGPSNSLLDLAPLHYRENWDESKPKQRR